MKERCKKYAGIRLDAFWKWVLLSVILALLIHVIFYFAAPVASVDKGIHNKTTKYGLPTY